MIHMVIGHITKHIVVNAPFLIHVKMDSTSYSISNVINVVKKLHKFSLEQCIHFAFYSYSMYLWIEISGFKTLQINFLKGDIMCVITE